MSLIKASIDFGTTYSGWAFSFRHEFERDPLQISAKQWFGGPFASLKGPTCVLIKPDKTFHSFGYDAEKEYAFLTEQNEHKQWYFFERFKMSLFPKVGTKQKLENQLKDILGKTLPAKTVFALAIRWLKYDMLEQSQKRLTGEKLLPTDVDWVLTVPAIWDPVAKQVMREAAIEAGIDNSRLIICLEPEAASLYCRSLPLAKTCNDASVATTKFARGTKYLVLDAGGGTIDITVHEVINDNEAREVIGASGGAWGGTKVDEAFERFLDEIACYPIMEALKTNDMYEYIEFRRDFEVKKRSIFPGKREQETIRIPAVLMELVKDKTKRSLEDNIKSSKYADQIALHRDKLKIDSNVMTSLFDESINSILSHLTSLLDVHTVGGCKTILMVGGFSESPVLQHAIENKFIDFDVIKPHDAALAVLKGAVIFGHKPSAIVQRVMRYTYGTRLLGDQFSVHVQIGESVKLDKELGEKKYCPSQADQTSVRVSIFTSPDKTPSKTTDPGCVEIGYIVIPIPDTSLGTSREFGVTYLFGGTELRVKVIDKTAKETFYLNINCLDQTKD